MSDEDTEKAIKDFAKRIDDLMCLTIHGDLYFEDIPGTKRVPLGLEELLIGFAKAIRGKRVNGD